MQHFKASLAGSPAPSLQQMLSTPAVLRKKPIPQLLQSHQAMSGNQRNEPREKYMRLRGKMRILQNAYLQAGDIADRDADVVFVCADGKVRAHKVVLVTATPFFNDIFNGQKAGSMSSVIVPDISAATMKIILLLAYKDNLTLTKKQMRDVALHLPMFGMDLKSFVFDENNLADQSGTPAPTIRKPPPMISRPNQGQFQQGHKIQRQIGSITISGTGGMGPLSMTRAGVTPSSSGDDDDFKAQFQGYDGGANPPPLKQIRISTNAQGQTQIVKKKPVAVPAANFRRIAPKPTDDMLPIQPAMDMTVGNQEIQFEDNGGDDGQVLDPEKGRLMIQEWMKNVSQPDEDEDGEGSAQAGSGSANNQQPRNQCLICNNIFDNPEKWRWHESHHVGLGIFKCAFCDELFSTSRKVYQHEMMEHGVSGSGTAPLDEPPGIPSDFQIVQGRKRRFQDDHQPQEEGQEGQGEAPPRMTLVRTANGSHYRRIPGQVTKKVLSKLSRKSGSPALSGGTVVRASATPNIACGSTPVEIEDRKMKQLHWVYVCNKCQTCSDSMGKAQAHFTKCFTDKSILFENSVMKYRQGFYGRCRCPLCPRRYTTNHGFTIHCGHMHNDFRRKFQHCSANDTVSCISCRKQFELPFQFHAHLGDDGECNAAPEYSAHDTSTKWIGTEMPGEKNTSTTTKKESKVNSKPPKLTPQNSTIAHGRTVLESQARSTRLANRRTMTTEAGVPEEEFEPAECPVCGDMENKIVEHLGTAHKEMELSVSRISNSALRCLKCAISFGIGDLVSHDTYCCIRSKQFQHVKERKLHHPKEPALEKSSANGLNATRTIPEGIGTSPVDTMEFFDQLNSKEFLRKAMRCGVCGRINSKLGIIADCLRSHGIYRCALCLNSYSDKNLYSTHLRTVHTGEKGRLKCPLCDRAQFVNAGQVAGHLLNAHWLKLIQEIYRDDRETNQSQDTKPRVSTPPLSTSKADESSDDKKSVVDPKVEIPDEDSRDDDADDRNDEAADDADADDSDVSMKKTEQQEQADEEDDEPDAGEETNEADAEDDNDAEDDEDIDDVNGNPKDDEDANDVNEDEPADEDDMADIPEQTAEDEEGSNSPTDDKND